MNTQTLLQKEIDRPETMNWTPVEVPVEEAAEEVAALHLKGMTTQYLLRRAYRVGKIGTRILIFLALGVSGLWTVVDFVKIGIEWFKNK